MFNCHSFVNSATYRQEFFPTPTAKDDSPLIVQFAGDEPESMAKAAALVTHHCDAIDINLGCPQGIARRGHYGAFLLSEPDLICQMIGAMRAAATVPITCKIRILDRMDDTLRLVRRIVEAGCSLLTVHGRTKEQLKDKVGSVNLDAIKAIAQIAQIPVFANGGVQNLEDVHRILSYTGANGVMTSEGILARPDLFNPNPDNSFSATALAREYLQFAAKYSADDSQIRAHLFKLLHRHLQVHTHIRVELAQCSTEQFLSLIQQIEFEDEKLLSSGEYVKKYGDSPDWYLRWQSYKGHNDDEGCGSGKANASTIQLADDLAVLDGAFSLFESGS